MKYLSLFSGIEAASVAWHPLNWHPVAFSEIEPFPCAVLKHHYPSVPNFGDVTKHKEWPDEPVELVVGGSPCQAFSVAGLRKGLDDPRGNLTLTFLSVVDQYKPKYVVWENVPGILSEKTGALVAFLDGLEELGYVIDMDILDAQYFGVPQRRRRVFVCGQSVDSILREKTISSALTIAQCLSEICLSILEEYRTQSDTEPTRSEHPSRSRDGLRRRMKLFGLLSDENCEMLRLNLAEEVRRSAQEPGKWESGGEAETDSSRTMDEESLIFAETEKENLSETWNTGTSWNNISTALSAARRLSTTSTATSQITHQEIFSC